MTDTIRVPESIGVARKRSDWGSPKGINSELVPWRLWEKAKQLVWDPADLDFSKDAEDWANLSEDQQITIASLARIFMVGEEAVTLDIAPLIVAMGDEGRLEETIYLTSFAFEEAKHVDFFRRWFTAIGADPLELLEKQEARLRSFGIEPPDPENLNGMFEKELPRVMRRVLTDRSPKAILDAAVTYNQFIEGCLAITGYRLWSQLFDTFGILPGMREGLRLVRRDESRHITYGTYLARRIMAAHPELLDFAKGRLGELRHAWFVEMTGSPPPPDRIDGAMVEQQVQHLMGNGDGSGGMPAGADFVLMMQFFSWFDTQIDARTQVLERAASLSESEAISDFGAEEEEAELAEV